MDKSEIALQLTLKAMEMGNGLVGIYNTDGKSEQLDRNVQNVSDFYNGLFEKLNLTDDN